MTEEQKAGPVRGAATKSELHSVLGEVWASLKNHGRAAEQYRLAVEADPEDWSARYNLGAALQQRGDHAGALEHLARAFELRPEEADVVFAYGSALGWNEMYAEAEDLFSFGYRKWHAQGDDRFILGWAGVLLSTGRHAHARTGLRKEIDLFHPAPVGEGFYRGLALACLALSEFGGDYERLKAGSEAAPRAVEVQAAYGQAAFELRHWGEAAAAFRAARDLDPENLHFVYAEGLALMGGGEDEAARRLLEAAYRETPEEPVILAGLGECLARAEIYAPAADVLGRAIKADPSLSAKLGLLAVCQFLAGEGQAARATLERFADAHPSLVEGLPGGVVAQIREVAPDSAAAT